MSVNDRSQAKSKGMVILPASLIFLGFLGSLKENIFPPRTSVDPSPKVQVPVAVSSDWYSFRQTLK